MIDGTSAISVRRPDFVVVGKNRNLSTRGWTKDAAEEHLKWHLTQKRDRWCAIECMAKVMFARNTEANRVRVRERIARLAKEVLLHGHWILREYDQSDHGRVKAVKFYEKNISGQEDQAALSQLNRARRRKEVDEQTYETIRVILGLEDTDDEAAANG